MNETTFFIFMCGRSYRPASERVFKRPSHVVKAPHAPNKCFVTVSYKLFGVAKTMQDQLVVKLKNVPFSLNLDEATSTNLLRVFSVLVLYYDKEKHSLVVEQLASLSVPVVDAENLFRKLQSVFLQFNLPWEDLLAMLTDSASVMRGEKNGLEKRVRDLVPHLIDIDGGSCHRMHNIVKNFTNHLDKFLEGLLRNIYTDFKTSADSLEMFKEISFHMELTFRKPVNYIAARWLLVIDTSLEFTYMRDAYRIY